MNENNQIVNLEQMDNTKKIDIKDLVIDNLTYEELILLKEEIELVIDLLAIKSKRAINTAKQIVIEKEKLQEQMYEELKSEKQKMLKSFKKEIKEELESEDQSSEELHQVKKRGRRRKK
jgi:tRNA A-37 threonylcarbamoyl transferase component Bud32